MEPAREDNDGQMTVTKKSSSSLTPFCRVTYNASKNEIKMIAPKASGNDINGIIESDKRYGVMKPANDKYFTFRIIDTKDNEVTEKILNRAVKYAWKSWTLRLNFDVRQTKKNEHADFRVLFRTPENDERGEMTKSTIMYHYFPISRIGHANRGLCVINPAFYYTTHGKGVPLHIIDPKNYPEPTKVKGSTIDIDGVLRHEFGHGIGLPHDPEPFNTMSTPYSVLAEFLKERDVMRGIAKYGRKNMPSHIFTRWWKWLRRKSEL